MSDKKQYMPPVALGEVMRAATIGIVEKSNASAFPVGACVLGFGGVAEYYVGIPGANVFYQAGTDGLPATCDLSVCSIIIGLTAWHGITKILTPAAGEVVVVSGAAGAVGSLAAQLAKLRGARVVGIAGSADKVAWLRDELKLDCCINYKTQDVAAAIEAFSGAESVNHYFDNVGGAVTDAVLSCMALNGKVALCGSISEYDDAWAGQKNYNMILMRRLSVQGFICTDHIGTELGAAKAELVPLVKGGQVKYTEDIREGIESYPSTVRLLLSGANTGKLILKV